MSSAKDNKSTDETHDTKSTDETHDTTVETAADSTSATNAKKGAPQENPFDDEDDDDLEVHPAVSAVSPTTETPTAVATGNTTPPTTNTAAPTEREAKLAILTEAFPTVEKEVCEFVLESHRGNVEASINALLEISDPEFQPEPAPPAPAPVPIATHVPTHLAPPLPQRQPDALAEGVANLNINQGQPREIDPILLASTSTSEQQLRSDEDFARTLAAMDEYRARNNRQNAPGQQPQNEGPSFATEMKELIDEELPKIKERFNIAADTTKKKVSEWYNQLKANRAEAAQRQAAQAQAQAQSQGSSNVGYSDSYRNHPSGDHWSGQSNDREPIRFGANTDRDGEEILARHRATPPLDGSSPPLPARPYDVAATTAVSSTAAGGRRTTVEDNVDWSFSPSHSVR